MSGGGLLAGAERARRFMLAGNARITLVSRATGQRFTFEVKAPRDSEPLTASTFFVAVLTGPNNESDYSYLGTIFRSEPSRFVHGKKSKIGVDAPSSRAFAWAWAKIVDHEIPASLEIWHEGTCGRCGRALTDPESIETGLGPVCMEKGTT